eukprot:Sspe_Gene.92594::Locus_65123_Transcript_1_6_Confidence_0.611_Length_482::g.92594::m.92594
MEHQSQPTVAHLARELQLRCARQLPEKNIRTDRNRDVVTLQGQLRAEMEGTERLKEEVRMLRRMLRAEGGPDPRLLRIKEERDELARCLEKVCAQRDELQFALRVKRSSPAKVDVGLQTETHGTNEYRAETEQDADAQAVRG